MTVINAWRAFKSFRIYQAGGGPKQIIGYLAKATAIGAVVGQVASVVAIKYVDYAAGDPRTKYVKTWELVDPKDAGGETHQVKVPVTRGGHLRRYGLRTMDEASDAMAVAFSDIGKWRKLSDASNAPSIIGEFLQQGGITPFLGFTTPDLVYNALDKSIAKSQRTTKKRVKVPRLKYNPKYGYNETVWEYETIETKSLAGWVVLGAKGASYVL